MTKSIRIASLIAFTALMAQPALAALTVSHTSGGSSTIDVTGLSTFTVDIDVDYATPPTQLTGIFVSAQWDPALLSCAWDGNALPFAILFGSGGFLAKLSDPFNAGGDDTASTLRTVQYGGSPGAFAGEGTELGVVTLDCDIVGTITSDTFVEVVLLQGDAITPGLSDSPDVVFNDLTVTVPEPGAIALGLSSLASVVGIAALRRRRE